MFKRKRLSGKTKQTWLHLLIDILLLWRRFIALDDKSMTVTARMLSHMMLFACPLEKGLNKDNDRSTQSLESGCLFCFLLGACMLPFKTKSSNSQLLILTGRPINAKNDQLNQQVSHYFYTFCVSCFLFISCLTVWVTVSLNILTDF